MARIIFVFVLFQAFLLAISSLAAKQLDETAEKKIVITRLENQLPTVDGRLDDDVWKSATFVSDFLQKEPVENRTPSERTEVAFLYDDDALYVGARMYHSDTTAISSIVTRRDNSGASERIIVSLDTYHDQRTAYSFSVTAAGVRTEYYHASDNEYDRDYSFDPVWEARTNIDSKGWTAEMRIPFSQLRFNGQGAQTWGINMNRFVPTRNEDIYWIVIPRNGTGWASRFGTFEGIEGIKPSLRIELLPYVAGSAVITGNRDPDDPFDDGLNLKQRVGLDAKMGLGPNLTLNATINPDFGQVEADPAEVNLSAFETFFSERRPFFIEGRELFDTEGPGYFYSRRIGTSPHGFADGDYINRPDNSTILGAAKITGRLPTGFSIGAIAALTGREYAEVYDTDTDAYSETLVEPITGFGVVRLRQEFGEYSSTAGLIVTGVERDLAPGEPLSMLLAKNAFTGGGDWNLRFNNGEYVFRGYAGLSYIDGDSNAIARVQRASARYYQRPDADYVEYDPSRTSMFGYTGGLFLSRNSGDHWLWNADVYIESPGFDLNDIGSISSVDDVSAEGSITYRETIPGKYLRNYSIKWNASSAWNFGGVQQSSDTYVQFNGTLPNFWSFNVGAGMQFSSLGDYLTRGGPLMRTPNASDYWGGINSDYAAKIRAGCSFSTGTDDNNGWYYNINPTLEMNLGDRWEVSLYPGYSRTRNARQYVTTALGGNDATYGSRYIFSFIDQTVLSASIRLNYAVTPDLTIEGYAEPFAASGHYFNFGELEAASSRSLISYNDIIEEDGEGGYTVNDNPEPFTIRNPDFNIRSFRSNLVIRWEWLRGSTLFLVWQQDRFGFTPDTVKSGFGDLFSSITDSGNNLLAIKASYWFPVD